MSALLFNAVTYDPSTGLYTYNYAVQNNSTSTIWNVDIFVGGFPQPGAIQPIPPVYTAPSGWVMHGAFSGWIAAPPYSMNGGFYEWYAGNTPNDIQPNTSIFGFSVVTPYAPTLDNGLNDFFLYGSEGIVAYGNVVVPNGADWLIQQPYQFYGGVPEPSTWLMLLIGFAALSAARQRRLTVHPAPLSS